MTTGRYEVALEGVGVGWPGEIGSRSRCIEKRSFYNSRNIALKCIYYVTRKKKSFALIK